jgi:hypothetical protein
MANSHFLNRSSVTLLSSFVERSVSCASTSPTTVSAPTAKAVAGSASTRNTTRCVRSWTAKAGHRSGLTHVISHLKAALKRGTSTCPFSRLLSQFANLKCMRLARLLTLSPLTTPCTLTRLITCVSPDQARGCPSRLQAKEVSSSAARAGRSLRANARWSTVARSRRRVRRRAGASPRPRPSRDLGCPEPAADGMPVLARRGRDVLEGGPT